MIRPKAGLAYLKVPSGSITSTLSEEFCTTTRNQLSSPDLPMSRMSCSFGNLAASPLGRPVGFAPRLAAGLPFSRKRP
jgi:hypothetical protein